MNIPPEHEAVLDMQVTLHKFNLTREQRLIAIMNLLLFEERTKEFVPKSKIEGGKE